MEKRNKQLLWFTVLSFVVWFSLLIANVNLVSRVYLNHRQRFQFQVDAAVSQALAILEIMENAKINADTSLSFDYENLGLQVFDSVLTSRLEAHDVRWEEYQLGYYCTDLHQFAFCSPDADPQSLLDDGFKYDLSFFSPSGKVHSDWLFLYFPNMNKALHWDMILNHGFLFLLLLLLLICLNILLSYIRKLRQLNDFRSKMVHNIVHELKTPLTTMNLACQLLKDDSIEKDPQMQHSYLDMITEETKSLQYLVDEALTLIRSKTLFDREPKPVEINKLIPTVVEMHRLSLNECHAELRLDLKAECDVVLGDYIHLSNAISNLIDNAIKYRQGDLVLEIGTKNVDDKVEIRVADNGIGIAKSDQPFIFEPLARFNIDNEHYVKGYGLGLHYVKTVVESHKGSVRVESELSQGATFYVYLPIFRK